MEKAVQSVQKTLNDIFSEVKCEIKVNYLLQNKPLKDCPLHQRVLINPDNGGHSGVERHPWAGKLSGELSRSRTRLRGMCKVLSLENKRRRHPIEIGLQNTGKPSRPKDMRHAPPVDCLVLGCQEETDLTKPHSPRTLRTSHSGAPHGLTAAITSGAHTKPSAS